MPAKTENSFRAFVASRSPSLLRTAYLLTGGDWATAEDLLQTALTKTYLTWGRINDPGCGGGIRADHDGDDRHVMVLTTMAARAQHVGTA